MRRIVVAFGVVAGCLMACSAILELEDHEPPLDANDATSDGPVDASAPDTYVRVDRCDAETDCPKLTNGCYQTRRCVENTCIYPVCEVRACLSQTCTAGSICDQKSTVTHAFGTTSYPLDGVTLGCIGERRPGAGDCVAAAFPFVIIGTKSGVLAVRADDFTALKATLVPIEIDGVAVVPQQIVSSGRRVWLLGAPMGGTLPIGWIDVPGDPTTKTLKQFGRTISFTEAPVVGFAAPAGGLFLVHNGDGDQGVRAAVINAPLGDNATIEAGVVAVPEGGTIVAASGESLVAYRGSAKKMVYNLITGSSVSKDQTLLPDSGFVIGKPTFGSGPDGTVFVSEPIAAPPDADCVGTSYASVDWLYPETATPPVVTDKYVAIVGDASACPTHMAADYIQPDSFATFIASGAVLVVASYGNPNGNGTSFADVRPVHEGDADVRTQFLTLDAAVAKGNFGRDRIGLTSSSGVGYLVMADGMGTNVSLTIFDPSCPATP